MLRLTLEIVPFGYEDLKKHLGTLEISRTTNRNNPEDYKVSVWSMVGELTSIFMVHQHAYEDGAWELARRATEVLLGVDQ